MEENLPTDNLPTLQVLKDSPKLLPMLYKDSAQPAVQKVGKALATVFDFSNTILLPLKLINEKARLNFQKHMESYKQKLSTIPEENIIDVSPTIGTPILDRLTYITNDEIANLFIELLAKASNSNTLNAAHPAFIHILDRITVDEARIIKYFHENQTGFIPFINFICRKKSNPAHYTKPAWNLTGLENEVELLCPENIDTYINNLSSLQIFESQGKMFKTNDAYYEKLGKDYEDIKNQINVMANKEDSLYSECEIEKGFYEMTELGKAFIKASQKQ